MNNQPDQVLVMPIYKTNIEVVVRQDTKEGIGLIDHEMVDQFTVWKFKGGQTTVYKDNQNYYESHNQELHKNIVLEIQKIKQQYQILLFIPQPIFIVVKDIKSPRGSEYPLTVNSVIRLGRVEYRVIEERDRNMDITQAPCFTKHIVIQPSEQVYQCRFCFMEGKQRKESLFLTNICRCQGNSQAVHLDCLRMWVDQNLTKEETHFGLVLKWTKAYECSICKDQLPTRVEFMNEFYDLFSLERPEMQYILLQNIIREKNLCSEMYLIHGLLTDNIKIGRAFTCDIKAQDITVSRHHATIRLSNSGDFVITDNKSKFGTLVSITSKQLSVDCTSISLQSGKLLFQLNQLDVIHKSSPSTQHKLTQLPQINKQLEEDEPQMDDDSFQMENK